jgi:hypothetical protein
MLVSIFIVMMFLTSFIYGLLTLGQANLSRASSRLLALQAQYAAESGADAALAIINDGNESYTGNTNVAVVTNGNRYKATYDVVVTNGVDGNEKIINATGKIYQPSTASTAKTIRKVQVVAKRGSSASSANVLSRNIVHIGASVKDIIAKDIFVNEYIQMDKNTNTFIAEKITVADRNPGSSNCSINGGKLEKPSGYGSKVTLKMAYENCTTPPGNTSNADFDVLINQTDIEKVQSTYIPWQFAMSNTTQISRACTEWAAGASPRTIPSGSSTSSPPGDQATSYHTIHYPDSGVGVDTTCTTIANKGSLDLGNDIQYNLNQNIHIRASLCSNSPCRPIFHNPSTTTRYVFVEGTINFEQIRNAAGSGPIVFVSYGSDPANLVLVCPEGGAVRVGQQGSNNTSAPQIFLLAANGGLCMDGTKFSGANSLGGVSGKNLYIATNSGTPFDLSLNPNFPISDIPINLTFKATQYRRIF